MTRLTMINYQAILLISFFNHSLQKYEDEDLIYFNMIFNYAFHKLNMVTNIVYIFAKKCAGAYGFLA